MKTTKFMAMLMATFALAFSFTSCGDDDDEPNPNQNQTVKMNELTIGGQTAVLKKGRVADADYGGGARQIEIRLDSEDGQSKVIICIYSVQMQNGYIPTGSYEAALRPTDGSHFSRQGYVINGIVSAKDANNGHGWGFNGLVDGSLGKLTVERSGDTYTLTIDKLAVEYYWNNDGGTTTTSLKYQGKLQVVDYSLQVD